MWGLSNVRSAARSAGVRAGGVREDKDRPGESDQEADDDEHVQRLDEAGIGPLGGVEGVAADVEEDEALDEVGERAERVDEGGGAGPRHVLHRVVADGHAAEEEGEDAGQAEELRGQVAEERESANERHLHVLLCGSRTRWGDTAHVHCTRAAARRMCGRVSCQLEDARQRLAVPSPWVVSVEKLGVDVVVRVRTSGAAHVLLLRTLGSRR